MNKQSLEELNSAQTFLRKVANAKTSNARKIKFLREKNISDGIILQAFKSIHPSVQIEEIMQFDDAFPDPKTQSQNSNTAQSDGWGAVAVGMVSMVTGALAYLGAYTSRENEIIQLKTEHEQALLDARGKIQEEIDKLREERDSDREQIMSLVKILGEQSTDVRKTLETLQESLSLIQAGVRSEPKHRSPEKTVSRITSLIDKKKDDATENKSKAEMPSWFNNPIEAPPENKKESKKEAMTQTDKADDSEIPSFDFEKQMSALQEAMKTFQRERSPQKFSKSVSTIQFYCTKILGDPTNQAFRAISKDNRRYKDYVQFVEGAPDILEALGFALKRNKLVLYLYEEDSTPYVEQLELVQEAQMLLKKLAEDPEAELHVELEEVQTAEDQFLETVASTKANASDDLNSPFDSPEETSAEAANHPYSADFSKVVQFIQSGKTPDDVRDDIDDSAPNPDATPSQPQLQIPRKPWEKIEEVG